MKNGYALPIQHLIQELGRLPGIGEKTATRLAMFLLRCPEEDALRLAESVVEVKRKIRFCTTCFHLSEGDLCEICRNPSRDRGIVCVVEDPDSLFAIEESGTYRGLYHVLHGVLAPLDGVGPEDLKIRELLERVDQGTIQEIILATNPTVQGESTALLIMKMLGERTVRVTRIAQGMPVGGDLKYTDRMTLAKSIECRRCM
ncbi:MAG: recombination mediator RecR [Syntrophales bacterium]|jgi:recombination protein RecR|nr:recombination mediator RecR [Syntrophales bacterium]